MTDTLLANGKVSVGIMFNTVSISIECRDDYEAESLFDELLARLKNGEKIQFSDGGETND